MAVSDVIVRSETAKSCRGVSMVWIVGSIGRGKKEGRTSMNVHGKLCCELDSEERK